MGVFDKIKSKILGAIEKSAVSQMSEEEKAKYAKEQAAKKPVAAGEKLSLQYTKEETSDLESLLQKLGAIDERKVWVGGFSKLRSNTNAKFANMFSGHKNLKFLTLNDDVFYMIQFKDDVIYSYKEFKKENVENVSKAPILAVSLFDKTFMRLEVTKNKQKLNEIFSILKAK